MIQQEHQPYDKSSKWLIQHHGDSLLRLAKIENIQTWRPAQAELVQPRQLPDGLLEVRLRVNRTHERHEGIRGTKRYAFRVLGAVRGFQLSFDPKVQAPPGPKPSALGRMATTWKCLAPDRLSDTPPRKNQVEP